MNELSQRAKKYIVEKCINKILTQFNRAYLFKKFYSAIENKTIEWDDEINFKYSVHVVYNTKTGKVKFDWSEDEKKTDRPNE